MRRPLPPGVSGHAAFARFDGAAVARLRLERWWDESLHLESGRPADDRFRPLVVIGVNPSDAGGDEDDNTSAKCTTFARREGANGLVMVNLHPGISTDPALLSRVLLPYGCDDLHWEAVVSALSENAVAIVAAWGKPPRGLSSYRDRVLRVKDLAADVGVALMCFGTNGDGSPKHPLYLAGATPLQIWWEPAAYRSEHCPYGNMPREAGAGHWREWHRGHGCHLDPGNRLGTSGAGTVDS